MTYTVGRDGQQIGTYSSEGLQRLLNDGQVLLTDQVWREEEQRWVPLTDILRQSDDFQAAQFARTLVAATPKVYVTPALIAINLAVFVLMVLTGVSPTDPTLAQLVRWGADFGPLTTQGQWWRLLTAAFVHIGVLHVLMNMYVLWSSGVFTERLFGNINFLLLYLLAGIGGNLASVALHPFTVAAGASGAVFGVYGGLLGYLLVQRKTIPRKTVRSLAQGALVFIGYNAIFGINPLLNIDLTAHFGGLITGFLAGCALAQPLVPAAQSPGLRRTLTVASIGIVIFIAAAFKLHAGDTAQTEWYRAEFTAPSITVGKNDSVIYSGAATKEEATQLGEVLKASGFFQDRQAQVLLSKTAAGGTAISFSVNDGKWDDATYITAIESFGRQVADSVGGIPIRIDLRDAKRQVRKSVAIDGHRLSLGTNDAIEYSGSATEADARALGETLRTKGFFSGKGGLALLSKGKDGTVVSLVVKEGVWSNPQLMPVIQDLGQTVSKVAGTPLRFRLLNASRETKKETIIQ
jgi:membrane associated rhomboid family serine protease